jgi:trimeric autotransporter adhesin
MHNILRRNRALASTVSRALAVGAIMLLTSLVTAQSAAAQATPEGTVITNQATASWTDANSNTYTAVNASVSVTVGFTAGISVTSPVSVTPASPSTSDQFNFTVTNTGNGIDTVGTVTVTPAAGLTITSYKIGATSYATLAALQTALNALQLTAGSNVVVTIVFDVAAGRGGQTMAVAIAATSKRTPATTNSSTTNVIPPVAAGVAVTPKAANVDRLPSNATQYSQVFPVQNNGNASDTYNLVASLTPGTAIAIVSVNGTAGTSSTITIGSSLTSNVTVVYTVGNVVAGTTDKLTLTATSQNNGAINDAGDVTVRVVKAALTIAKVAYLDNQTTVINNTTDRVLPGQFIQYKVTVTNTGLASASTVSVSDALPAQVTWQSTTADVPAEWTLSQAAGTVTANLTPTLAAAGSRFIWIRVQVK